MTTPVNLTESQQNALNAYREALGQRFCCNQGACPGCNAPRVRREAAEAGVPGEELLRALRESRGASRERSRLLSEKLPVAETPPAPPVEEAP